MRTNEKCKALATHPRVRRHKWIEANVRVGSSNHLKVKFLFVPKKMSNKKIPIWISDYVLNSYGTGAIMAVPAHDERDYEFAKKVWSPYLKMAKKSGRLFSILH